MRLNLRTFIGVIVGVVTCLGIAHALNFLYSWESLALIIGFTLGLEAGFFSGHWTFTVSVHRKVMRRFVGIPFALFRGLGRLRALGKLRNMAMPAVIITIGSVIVLYFLFAVSEPMQTIHHTLNNTSELLGLLFIMSALFGMFVPGIALIANDERIPPTFLIGTANYQSWVADIESGRNQVARRRFLWTLIVGPLYFLIGMPLSAIGLFLGLCSFFFLVIPYFLFYTVVYLCLARQTIAIAIGTVIGSLVGMSLGWSDGDFTLILRAMGLGAAAGCASVYLLSLLNYVHPFTWLADKTIAYCRSK